MKNVFLSERRVCPVNDLAKVEIEKILLEISRQKNCWQESDLLDAADGALKEMDPRPHPWWLE